MSVRLVYLIWRGALRTEDCDDNHHDGGEGVCHVDLYAYDVILVISCKRCCL